MRKYTAVLWACRRRFVSNTDRRNPTAAVTCDGYRYLEPDEEPGFCHRETYVNEALTVLCPSPMDRIGEFELETS